MRIFKFNNKISYTLFFLWLANLFGIYYCFSDFIVGSKSWILSFASIILLNILIILGNTKNKHNPFHFPISKRYQTYFLKLTTIYYLYSCTYGLVIAIINSPIKDKSYLGFPFIIIFLGFTGAVLNIYNKLIK